MTSLGDVHTIYNGNNGDGTVAFRCSHLFCNVAITMSLPYRKRCCDNGCHGERHGDST